jgi:hypothetical protein
LDDFQVSERHGADAFTGFRHVEYRNYTPAPAKSDPERERNELKDQCEHKSDPRHGPS